MYDDNLGYDAEQAARLAQHLYESILDYPHVMDSATAIVGVVILSRHVLGQAAYHELPHAGAHIRQAFCSMVSHTDPQA
jgi:hypothetical protein